MKWIGERISFVDDKTKTTIVIHPKDIGFMKALMGAWVFMWMTIGAVVIFSLLYEELSQQDKVIVWVFLIFWAYYAFRVTKSWFWMLWGKELIMIDEVKMSYKKSIRNYGKSTPFFVENISKMRLHKPKENSIQAAYEKAPWIVGGERIEFDYYGSVFRFGRKIDEKDAEKLFKFITKKIEDRVRKLK